MTSRAPDASIERRAFLSPSSPHSGDTRAPSDVQTRPRKASNVHNSPLHRLYALIAVVGLLLVLSLVYATGHSTTSLREDPKALEIRDAYNIPRRLAKFQVNQTSLDNLDTISVEFEYKQPQPEFYGRDRVAAYCVSSADERTNHTPTVHEFMDFVPTNAKGSGVVKLGPLVNMRCSWLLRFVTGDDQVLGESQLLRFKRGPTQPLQVHLALTQHADEMRVKWVSDNVTNPVVKFGENKLERVKRATQSSYQAKDMCDDPATTVFPRNYRDPGQIFDAVMTKLEAGKKYLYQVGDEKGELSDVLEFRMPPATGSNSASTDALGSSMSFFVYGDLNTPVGATENFAQDDGNCGTTAQLIHDDMEQAAADPSKHRYVAVMHIGDLAYGMGSTYIWDQFGHLIEYVAARLPYMISIGNHGVKKDHIKYPSHLTFEKDGTRGYDSYGECGVPSEKRFHMPDNGNGVYWYSFDTGLAHHAVVSSEHEFARGSPLHKWLVNDLKSVDRSKTPWLFVYIHRPLYCSVAYSGDYYRSLLFRDELEQEFAEYHVDIVFSGHYHSYERTCAVFGDRCIESPSGKAMAPVHIMVGSGGYQVDDAGFYRSRWRQQGFLEHGYGRVHIYNLTHLYFEFVSDVERKVKDDAWIVSTHDWPTDRERYPPGYFPAQDIAGFGAAVVLALLACSAVLVPARRAWNNKYTPVSPILFSK
ncbi:Calcineurin-like phosphoesterase [Phytophthora megakarya]|uniref:Purple acid phosphatase n=1 Tax=Phytophthora megakarya TaxID=4795 RepID=A0A225W0B7_9STRA|nr:Calcineurin-like phosphoesterase [Phytophthora megakarya]